MNIQKTIEIIDGKQEILNDFLKNLRKDKMQDFYVNDGCVTCMGRGKVVDEYGFIDTTVSVCSNKDCTEASRKLSGIHPKRIPGIDDALDIDWHSLMNDEELESFKLMQNEIKSLKVKLGMISGLKIPKTGRIARVVKKSRVKNPPPIDTDVYIVNTFVSSWGVDKSVVIDKECNVYYPSNSALLVKTYVPRELREEWKNVYSEYMLNVSLPIVCIVKKETRKATLLKTLKGIEFWAPKNQIKFDGEIKENEVMSVYIPQWLAKKNNLIREK